MKPKGIKYLLLLISVYSFNAFGQSCAENLEIARQYYRDGQLRLAHEVLAPCLSQKKQLTEEKTIAGYRLLANVSFLLDSTSRGEQYLRNILNSNVSFQSDETDVFQFRQRLSDIRKIPSYQIGLSIGFNRPVVTVDDTYDAIFNRENALLVSGLSDGDLLINFKEKIGPNISLIFVKNIFDKIDVETGIGYQSTKFTYFDLFSDIKKETRVDDIQIPILANYRLPILYEENTVGVQAGINVSLLNTWRHGDKLSGELSTNTTDVRSSASFSGVLGVFMNVKVGKVILRPNLQYWVGLTQRSEQISDNVNAAFAYNESSFLNYNSRFDYFIFSIGILKQRF